MELNVSDLKYYDFLGKSNEFNGFGGEGENISPSLSWSDAPKDAKSFAVTVFDPDAETGSGFWHWVIFDIPSTVRELPAGTGNVDQVYVPGLKQASCDFGHMGYGGACPPEGDNPHRYIFTLHALSCEQLDINKDMPNAVIRFMINAFTISMSSVTVLYQR